GMVKSLWSYRFQQTPHLARLTTPGALFTAVDYSPLAGRTGAGVGGQGGGGVASVFSGGLSGNGLASGARAAVQWSSDGSSALYVVAGPGAPAGALWTWTPLRGQVKLASSAALSPFPAWSPDATQVLYDSNGSVFSAVIAGKTTP